MHIFYIFCCKWCLFFKNLKNIKNTLKNFKKKNMSNKCINFMISTLKINFFDLFAILTNIFYI